MPRIRAPEEPLSTPLDDTDPRQLGAFRLQARLDTHPAGVVYRAVGRLGEPVQVAMLYPGAAADPAARERFAAAVDAQRGPRSQVVAASTGGAAVAWVAVRVSDAQGAPGAAGFLEAAVEREAAVAGGPGYVPHWGHAPGTSGTWYWTRHTPPDAAAPAVRPRGGVLLGLLAVLALLLVVLVPLYLALSLLRPDPGVPAGSPTSPESSPEDSDGDGEDSGDPDTPEDAQDPAEEAPGEGGESPGVPRVPLDEDELSDMPTPAQSPEDLT